MHPCVHVTISLYRTLLCLKMNIAKYKFGVQYIHVQRKKHINYKDTIQMSLSFESITLYYIVKHTFVGCIWPSIYVCPSRLLYERNRCSASSYFFAICTVRVFKECDVP